MILPHSFIQLLDELTKEVAPVDLGDLLHPRHAHALLAKGWQPCRT
jgi:hypothetical protein